MYTIETGNDIDMLTRTWFCPVTIMKCCPIFFVTINYVSFSKMPLRCLKFCFPICCIFTPRATVHLFNLYKYLDKVWLYGGVYACGNTISTIPCFQSLQQLNWLPVITSDSFFFKRTGVSIFLSALNKKANNYVSQQGQTFPLSHNITTLCSVAELVLAVRNRNTTMYQNNSKITRSVCISGQTSQSSQNRSTYHKIKFKTNQKRLPAEELTSRLRCGVYVRLFIVISVHTGVRSDFRY